LAPRLKKKRIPLNLGSQFVTFKANVPTFITNSGPNNNPKLLKIVLFVGV
jgi:hypothetical protein